MFDHIVRVRSDQRLSESSTSPSTATTEEGLVRGIRRWDLVLLVLNSVIGAGIFGLPARTFALVGSWSLLAYVVCAGIIVLLGLSFAEVASRFCVTGGPFVYVREAYGPTAGFLTGWPNSSSMALLATNLNTSDASPPDMIARTPISWHSFTSHPSYCGCVECRFNLTDTYRLLQDF